MSAAAGAAAGVLDAPTPAALRTVVRRRILTPVTAAFAAMALLMGILRLAGVTIPDAVQVIPFAVSILVFGLPHGAMDHLVPTALRPRTGAAASILVVVALYAVVGLATVALWRASPVAGFVAFVLLTWFHWGQGDLFIDHLLGEGPASRADAVVTVLLRGAFPMLLPLVAAPGDYAAVLASTVRAVDPGAVAPDALAAGDLVRPALAVVVLGLAVVQPLLRPRGARARQATESAVLIALFLTTPPVLAVGLYFTLWHAVRHIVRLELLRPESAAALARGDLRAPFARFLRDAWPITLAAVVLLVAFALTVGTATLGTYLVFIAALTTPHALIVTWMDRVQRSWRPTRSVARSTAPPLPPR